ncbi:MAG: hypothetical protein ACHQD8_06915 [Chitinophagales bacterium]
MKSVKHLLIVAIIMVTTINAKGQIPQIINYQAVARNASGAIITSQPIGVRLTVHDVFATGTVQYQETQTATTNAYGLFTLEIGSGAVVSGTMNGVTWGSGAKFLQVEVDPAGGSSYVNMGSQQLASVPYSLYAENANTATTLTGNMTMGGDVTGTNNASTVVKMQGRSISATAPTAGQELTWNSGTSLWTPTTPSGGTVTTINTTAPLTGGPVTTSGTIGLANSGVTAGTYGTATQVPTVTVDAFGRVTSASNTAITTGVAGTANYIPMFTSATTIGNSIMYENPAASNRIGINYGTTNHGLVAIRSTADTEALYINMNASPSAVSAIGGGGGYGIFREEYSGPNDNVRTGILATTIKALADVKGIGIEGAGNSQGVYGIAEASSTTGGTAIGTEGDSYYDGAGNYSVGIYGSASNWTAATSTCYGVYGTASGGATNYAGYFQGNVRVTGSMAKGSGTFEIDHPLDPANKYLYHSFVESPDMMNIYNGNITTDATGTATVTLPDYFDALNKDFRYQLTVIGTFAQAIISEKIHGNTFTIKTSVPNVEVSWQVTGVRQDAYANAHRVVPEVEKGPNDKGKYLYPKEMGQPAELGIGADIKHNDRRNDPALISHGPSNQK